MTKSAVFSECRTWRYVLTRVWDESRYAVNFIGLNPSTADEDLDDPTIRRCIRFARDWGYGALVMTNLFAYRATNPRDMLSASDPVGPENDRYMTEQAAQAGLVVAAWGVIGQKHPRAFRIGTLLPQEIFCLGRTKEGAPKHPLYVSASTQPSVFLCSFYPPEKAKS